MCVADVRWRGAVPGCINCVDKNDEESALRRERHRLGDVCHNRALANCRGIAGLLDSGAAADEGGSDGRAPL